MGDIIYLDRWNEGIKMNRESKFNLIKYILYFANHTSSNLYKTKLNKLLFYTQFLYYKENEKRLLNDEFICDYHGPTIDNLDKYLYEFKSSGFINLINTEFGTVVSAKVKLEDNKYEKDELGILIRVNKKFKEYTSKRISDYSHDESLWSEDHLKEIIQIERAKELHDF